MKSTMDVRVIQKKQDETLFMLVELEKLKSDIKFISNKEAPYFKLVVEKSIFIKQVYLRYIKLFVIDINKLLWKCEHFSLIKTINYIRSNRKKINWKHELSIQRLNELELRLKSLDTKSSRDLRNKYFAHNDKHKLNYDSRIDLEKLWDLLRVAQEVFKELDYGLMGNDHRFEIYSEGISEIVSLFKYKQIQKLLFEQMKMRGGNIGELQKVRDIMIGKVGF